jgi:hypothetical protein
MTGQLVLSVFMGVTYIVIGLLCLKKPNLISGYHRLDNNKKQRFPALLFKSLIITSGVTVSGCFVSFLFNSVSAMVAFTLFPILFCSVYVLWYQKRTSTGKNRLVTVLLIFFIVLMFAVPVLLYISSREPNIIVQNDGVKITGFYGETITFNDIKSVELIDKLPAIKLRINGFGLGAVLKGDFLLEEVGNAKLFVNSFSGTYIKLQKNDGRYIFIGLKDSQRTMNYYNQIVDGHE